uniref:Dimerisation domain-containing protein n=1 Tax=Candidatus Kentrum sp. DK TaxID=2126562 RepID=A0A450T7R0_9GAMM|nr:MAG: Dimerisation domain-containing protein [Candidatus Kentron sp. DK]
MHLSPENILKVGTGFWASKTLLSAVELGLFTELARKPGDVIDLQKRIGLHPRAARDFLDTLAALGFLRREEGIYYNTPETEQFLNEDKPAYLGGFLRMLGCYVPPYSRETDPTYFRRDKS